MSNADIKQLVMRHGKEQVQEAVALYGVAHCKRVSDFTHKYNTSRTHQEFIQKHPGAEKLPEIGHNLLAWYCKDTLAKRVDKLAAYV